MEIELFPYIHLLFKIAMSQSNGLRVKNIVELRTSDVSWSSRVFAMELCCEFWCKDFRSRLPGVVFAAVSFPLDEFHYKGAEPLMREFLRRACGSDIQCVEEDFVA